VLLVIASVATEIYVMVVMCLVDWKSGNTRLLGMHAFYSCCMVLSSQSSCWALELITRPREAMLSLAASVGKVHFTEIKEEIIPLTIILWVV
jgi:hypothetical protein